MTLPPVGRLPSREALAAWLDLEAALISATQRGTEERKRLRVVMVASRPNDNEHVASARRIARALRDPEITLTEVLARVRSARHFRAAVRHTIERLMGPTPVEQASSIREAYLAGLPERPEHGKSDFEVRQATDERCPAPRACKVEGPESTALKVKGPDAESVIDTTDPHWMIPGPNEPCIEVRTDQGTFEIPVSSLKPASLPN